MIPRILESYIKAISLKYPIITLTGPRQSGKTTLSKAVFPDKPYINLEKPDIRDYAASDPNGFLSQYPNGAVLDEIQNVPLLISYIQVITDEKKLNGQFILTGSSQFEMMQTINQSLAGRTAIVRLLPFSLEELKHENHPLELEELLYKGFYPRIYDQNLSPTQALSDYYQTYIERDVRLFMQIHNLSLFQKFIRLCAGRVGQLLNLQSLANDTGISSVTARSWLSILEASYIIFLLNPYYKNISKRLVKSPKLYFYDPGLAVFLCGIEEKKHLHNYPLIGNFFENMVIIEALKYRYNRGKLNNLLFYRDSNGNEVDLLYTIAQNLTPIDIKSAQTYHDEFLKGIKKFAVSDPDHINKPVIVYAGTEKQFRQNTAVINYQDFPDYLHQLD